jgi:hypothetical protein
MVVACRHHSGGARHHPTITIQQFENRDMTSAITMYGNINDGGRTENDGNFEWEDCAAEDRDSWPALAPANRISQEGSQH